MKKTATQIITEYLDRSAIQSKITQLKNCKVTENNAIAFALEYNAVRHFVQSAVTQRKLDRRYSKAVKFIQATVETAKEFRDAVRAERLQNEPYDSSHLPTCAVGTEQDFGGDCCCAEAREQMRGGRA